MISVIIPTLNEEKKIEALLKKLSECKNQIEIIIADGGSTDRTIDIVKKYNAKIIITEKGRAKQMNEGAKNATGNIFWFLHSDSIIEIDHLIEIENAICKGNIAGCFSLYFYDYENLFLKLLAITSNWRAKYLKLIFGDQGFFIKKTIFEKLNGFKEIPIMEDWDISKRVYKLGSVKVLPEKIGTSARRFKQGGYFKTLFKMHKIKIKYIFGVKPETLINEYNDIR